MTQKQSLGETMALRAIIVAVGLSGLAAIFGSGSASAQAFAQGPDACKECHKAESGVWEGSQHAKSFKEIAANPKAKEIVAAVGEKDMRRTPLCISCHFSEARKEAADKPRIVAGPSCESCHGASSEFIKIHNNYGGPTVKREQETPENKKARIDAASKAGMIWSFQHYEIAENCNSCHGMTNPALDPAVASKMIDAGHPISAEFELVRYSQGTVRHRFYPPDMTKNAEMTPAELSRFFLTGQAAALVASVAGQSKISNAKYVAAQKERETKARAAIDAVKGQAPAAAALLAQPTEANAKSFVGQLAGKDFTAQVGKSLPAPASYK